MTVQLTEQNQELLDRIEKRMIAQVKVLEKKMMALKDELIQEIERRES